MPIFLILPLWLLALAASVVLAQHPRTRPLGLYLATGSSGAMVGSFGLSTGLMLAVSGHDFSGSTTLAILISYFALFVFGGLAGAAGAIWIAHRFSAARSRAGGGP